MPSAEVTATRPGDETPPAAVAGLTGAPWPMTQSNWTDTGAPAGTTLHCVVSLVAADGTESFTDLDSAVTLPSGS